MHFIVDTIKSQLQGMIISVDPPNDVKTGPNVASLKAECGTKFSWAKSPGFVFWCKYYFVLKNEDTTLYEFKTDLVGTGVE